MNAAIVIPARWASTRFPGKPLALIAGVSLIQRVYERAVQCRRASAVYVATDDDRIAAHVASFGGRVVRPRGEFATGTDRIAASLELLDGGFEQIVNVQGDEPLIEPALIRQVAERLAAEHGASIASACHAIHDARSLDNPNVVKVVLDARQHALYFSRARIPYAREGEPVYYRHAGIYAYRAGFLEHYASLAPAPLERAEALEQLRALWHGHRIAVVVSERDIPPGVDTPDDLAVVLRMFR